ncbi:hypothetical protein [Mycobacteroides saopaulense]|uniref:hypothetical protein n=1 Tax=Mycobacteroides saopaulense TaxID=1578165 RepID=UPI001041FB1F|nr:hypothetical protein [Mycobacteroides saopaulense]
MSRTTTPALDIPAPPPGLELSPVPNIKGNFAAARWVRENLNIPMTDRFVRVQTNEGRVRYSLIMGARYYSRRDLYEWIMGMQKGSGS